MATRSRLPRFVATWLRGAATLRLKVLAFEEEGKLTEGNNQQYNHVKDGHIY